MTTLPPKTVRHDRKLIMPDDPAADYADDPADVRPGGFFDRGFAGLDLLLFLVLLLTPCALFAPLLLLWAALGVLACRSPAARLNAWLLLIVSAIPTLVFAMIVLAVHIRPGN